MATNFAELAFGDVAKDLQTQSGSRAAHARLEQQPFTGLTDIEETFISRCEGFYLATVGDSGFPYVQFRGGPAGFLKMLDPHTLGFLDFRGNQQFISVGNLASRPKAGLILMDYARRTRLRFFATIEVLPIDQDPALTQALEFPRVWSTEAKPVNAERVMLLHIDGYDWACPKYITPRYTTDEFQPVIASYQDKIDRQAGQIADLTQQLVDLQRKQKH